MFDLFTIAKLLLTIANRLFSDLHDRGKMNEGRQLEIGDQLKEISISSGIIKQIDEKFDRMSEDEINKYLKENNDYED